MRFLVVSPTPTHPQDAGNRARIHAVLAGLKAAGHQVTLCLLARETMPPGAVEAMRAAWDELVLVPHDRRAERPSLPEGVFALDDWIQAPLEEALLALAARRPGFDAVLVEYVFLSRAFSFFPPPHLRFPTPVLKLLDTHDVFGGRDQRLRELGLVPGFFFTTPEEEARGLARADLVLAIQDEEREAFELVSDVPVLTLGHVAADPRPPLPPRAPDGRFRVGYLGSANPLNTRALRRFLAALDGPAFAAAGGTLVVAGAAATAAPPAAWLETIGEVADPDDLYAQVDLVVNPHEGGTGLKIKTVEALARGRPVVGTMAAFAGLAAESAFHAAADAAEVARLVQRAAGDAGLRHRIAAASAALWSRYSAQVAAETARLASPRALRLAAARPRALIATDIPFWEERLGNHARITALARAARAEMDLDLFYLGAMDAAARARAQALLGARSRLFQTGALPAEPPVILPRPLTRFERLSVSPTAFAAFARHLEETPPDAVILEYIRLSYLRHAVPKGVMKVLDTHDIMSLRARNFAHFGRRHFLDIGTGEELEILSGFDQVLAIQQEEWRWLDGLLPGRALLAPHVVPPVPRAAGSAGAAFGAAGGAAPGAASGAGSGPAIGAATGGALPRIGFLGGDSPMNRDGLEWLLDQVWPAIHRLGAELHVAGEVCAAIPPGRPGVVAHGPVASPSAFLARMDIAVNPVFYGGGLKIKTVEYLCHGLPSVLTAEALYGIAGGAGEAYALALDRAGFVAALAELVLDPARRARMGEAAFAFGRRHFGPAALAPALRTIAQLARGVDRPAPLPATAG